ncbi:hypothetical protein K432DRAFT_138977 [Lepidopterella palustris CBS 459.81]|uniref:Uncharacterized protein n=1 Tax=Lepidopterella palustris CBS 459.81 TaxID=1314670 RepID=A0A8E2E3Q7_9PEZI|nr:hypothetical protein K432DRAFT_138977 [Lepidopterella palustris CBS 459.81]
MLHQASKLSQETVGEFRTRGRGTYFGMSGRYSVCVTSATAYFNFYLFTKSITSVNKCKRRSMRS